MSKATNPDEKKVSEADGSLTDAVSEYEMKDIYYSLDTEIIMKLRKS